MADKEIVKVDSELYYTNCDFFHYYDDDDDNGNYSSDIIKAIESKLNEVHNRAFYVYSGNAQRNAEESGKAYDVSPEEWAAAERYCKSKLSFERESVGPMVSDQEFAAFLCAYFEIEAKILYWDVEYSSKNPNDLIWPQYAKNKMKILGFNGAAL